MAAHSPAADPAAWTTVFPPPRFQALQLVQSKPDAHHSSLITVSLLFRPPDSGTPDFSLSLVVHAQAEIAARTGQPTDAAISSARHAACLTLFECVVRVSRPRADWRERVDHVAMHPIWGYAVLMAVFLGFFRLIFDVGKLGEDRILSVFDALVAVLTQHMNPQGPMFAASKGAVLEHGRSRGDCAALPAAVPGGTGDSGRHWHYALARRLSDGRGDAPRGTARHGDPSHSGGLWVQRSGGDGDKNSHHPARPLHLPRSWPCWCPAPRA